MGRPSKTQTLVTWLNGERVGTWSIPPHAEPSFTYEESWFSSPAFRSLSLSLPAIKSNPSIKGAVVNDFFDNLLPDSEIIRKRLQTKFRASDTGAFALLAAVGRDCVGAVQLMPQGEAPEGLDRINATPLDDNGVERILQQATATPSALADDEEDDLRLSIAGAQEKTALIWHNGGWCKPLQATPTTHIFKLPMGLVGNRRADMSTSVENEWLCGRILHAYDIPVAPCDIAVFGQTKALVVQRFDRQLARSGTHWLRLPQEDFCQATGTPAARKYEADGGPGMLRIAALLGNAVSRDQDIATFLKAQIVFWMLRATDGHAKNFSIFLLAGDRYKMTPLYDVLSAWPVIGQGPNLIPPQRAKMAMAWLGKNRHYHADSALRRHMTNTMLKCGYGASPGDLIDQITEQTPAICERVAAELPPEFPASLAVRIFEGLLESARQLQESPNRS
ncbi:MAG: type II toxin-antitoxin system HipA family toxin [Collimonas sp.]|uniref:type II toxin-antitoxin system HipA family toxin n=1 Tax=Collimonas sp. TaxID=1963772 RepID=UPI003264CDFE